MKSLLLLPLLATLLLGCDCPGNEIHPSEPLYEGYVEGGDVTVTVTAGEVCRATSRVRLFVEGAPLYHTNQRSLPITFRIDTAEHRIDIWSVSDQYYIGYPDSLFAEDFSDTLRMTRDTTIALLCP